MSCDETDEYVDMAREEIRAAKEIAALVRATSDRENARIRDANHNQRVAWRDRRPQ